MQQWQIGKTTPETGDLEVLLKMYPWFAIAHQERFRQLAVQGEEYSKNVIKSAAPYLFSYDKLVKEVKRENKKAEPATVTIEEVKNRDIFVVGGDYFGKEEYQSLKDSSEPLVETFKGTVASERKVAAVDNRANDQFSDDEYCTETLAKIYVAQGCFKRALEVYDKLILLYPEKNTYFAALKEEIKKLL